METNLIQIFGNYMAWQPKKGTWFISFMNGSQYLYLLEGDEKALLIDTGFGAGNLRSFVETLTKKPIVVVNTHFHPDHSGGNGEFEKVYVAEGYQIDAPSVETPGMTPFDLTKLPYPDYEKIIVRDGDKFELGNRNIEVLAAKSAHCNSSIFLLDRSQKLVFTGDEYEAAQTIMFDNSHNPDAPYDVKERLDHLKENAVRLLELRDLYDMILPNHNGTPIDIHYLEDYVKLVDGIYNGTAVIEDKLNHFFIEQDPRSSQMCRVRFGDVSIFISKEEVMKVYGTTDI